MTRPSLRRKHGALLAGVLLAGCSSTAPTSPPAPSIDLTAVRPAEPAYTDDDVWHLQFAMAIDEGEPRRYLETPPEEREEFLRLIWARVDPTPTTERNERRDAHYLRLAYVREYFAIDQPPYWDRRGELLLRYGAPDDRQIMDADVAQDLHFIAAREVWTYRQLGQAYRLEDQGMDGNFQDHYDVRLHSLNTSDFRNVAPVGPGGPVYDLDLMRESEEMRDEAAAGHPEFVVLDGEGVASMDRQQTLYARGQEAYTSRPAAYLHDHGGGKLDFVFDVMNFARDGTDRTVVDVNTAFWANDLEYMREGDGYVAVLGVEGVVKTTDYREVARVGVTTRDPKTSIDDLKGRLVLDQLRFELDPGMYRLALSVRDSLSRDVGIFTTEMEVRPFDGLELSDIQLALDVRRAEAASPFMKGPYQVVPYPFGTFPTDRDIYLYFEIYGLEGSPTGDVFYTVDLLIRPETDSGGKWFGSSKGRVVPGVATSFDGRGREGVVREYIVLDPSTFHGDVYDVEITVRDRVFERDVSRSIRFGVQND